MKITITLASALLALALSPQALAKRRAANKYQESTTQIRVVENFWTALGSLDPEALKQTLDWPVSIVEASDRETKNPHVLTSPTEIDKEFAAHRPASGRSEFFGTQLSDFKVQLLNKSLALVTYTAKLPKDISAAREGDFNAVAILRRSSTGDVWKIIFITVPK